MESDKFTKSIMGRGYKADGPTKSDKFTVYNRDEAIEPTALQKVTSSLSL